MGWTTRAVEMELRAPAGRSKLAESESDKSGAAGGEVKRQLPAREKEAWGGGRTGIVSEADAAAAGALAEAEDAKGDAIQGAQRDGLDDGRRQDGHEQQAEGGHEHDGQRGGGTQHGGGRSGAGEAAGASIARSRVRIRSGQGERRHTGRRACL